MGLCSHICTGCYGPTNQGHIYQICFKILSREASHTTENITPSFGPKHVRQCSLCYLIPKAYPLTLY